MVAAEPPHAEVRRRPASASRWRPTSKVELPEEFDVVQSDGSTKNATEVAWEVPAGSELRLQQLLAGLGYLPYKWTGEEVAKTPEAQVAAATTETPKGHFAPRWGNTPSGLKELWAPGEENVLVEGALMSFEERNGLEVDGQRPARSSGKR